MTPTPVKPLTFTISPTVKEIYEEGEAEFIAAGEIPQMALLSNENDKVSGLESLYGIILREHHRKLPVSSVTGNEGFMDSIREGFKKLIQVVKDFFKWFWSLFASKEKDISDKISRTEEKLDKNGAKSGAVPYPMKAVYIYKKQGKPDNNLHWIKDALLDVVKIADKTTAFVKDAEKLMTAVTSASEANVLSSMTELPKELSSAFLSVFKLEDNKQGTLLTPGDVIFKDGQLSEETADYPVKQFMGASFVTTTDEVRSIIKDSKEAQKKINELGKTLFNLEEVIVKNLQKAIAVTSKPDVDNKETEKASSAIKDAVRKTMANLKFIQSTLFWALGSANAITVAATA